MSTHRPKDIPLGEDLGEILDKEEAKSRPARARLRALIRRRPGIAAAARSIRDIAPKQRLARVQVSIIFAFQCALAAALAYFIAIELFDHHNPFFAPMAGIITLGVSGGKRLRRAFELVLGVSLGVGIGDLVIREIGAGYWQIAVVVFTGIVIASFVDRSPMVAMQAANTGVLIATLLPPGSGGSADRMVDALIGGVIGMLVMAIVPRSPLRAARRDLSSLISKSALVLDEVAAAMELGDGDALAEALETARGTQSTVNSLMAESKGGDEIVTISPLYWSARRHSRSMQRALLPVDNLVRNIRVLARRAEMVEIPEVIRALQKLASEAKPEIIPNQGLSGLVIVAQVRSAIVDALMVCGYSRPSAMASLAPTVKNPWHPPEVWGEDPDFDED
ncbi:MAG: hypothetical protein DI609_09340 [Corynebacterium urealyticum]|uniref:Integral membrane bound transporter domain-containing protein n=1 Tax=Corynebacterium urealyticum TaxID=43771 RepID=A0A2W5B2Y1_9CORY|nr:MAG: hypothetical protein DI609_09340 [Corynebacterium urealyticum]